MATTIVAPQVDIVELILDAVQMPEQTDELDAALDVIADTTTPQQRDAIWSAAMTMLNHGHATAFRLGWEMRGQV